MSKNLEEVAGLLGDVDDGAPGRTRLRWLGMACGGLLSVACAICLSLQLRSSMKQLRGQGSADALLQEVVPIGVADTCFENGIDFQGHDLFTDAKIASGAAECKALCLAIADCMFFTWEADGSNHCWLKSSDVGLRAWDKRISGPRVCLDTPQAQALPQASFCNASMPTLEQVTPREFHMPNFIADWCKSDAVKPPGTWSWPGRNWCWLNTKVHACYSEGALPNWWWAQETAAQQGLAPHPTDVLLPGLEDPLLCDRPELGAALIGVSQNESAEAKVWASANLAVYVLNLDWAVDRWNAMKARLESLGITPIRISGVDVSKPGGIDQAKTMGLIPPTWDYERAQKNVWKLFDFSDQDGHKKFYDAMGIGTVGCAAAHLRAQRVAADKSELAGKPLALILEDDVWVEDDFVVKLRRLLTDEAPCGWDAIALTSRCSYGMCVSPHLSRVQPDGNEPNERCHTGTNYGMYGTLYQVSRIPFINGELQRLMWNDTHAGCLPVDIAMAAISDQMAYYAVPHAQKPGFMNEANMGSSNRWALNR